MVPVISMSNHSTDFNSSSSKACQDYISTFLKKHNKTIAYGGYLEKRDLYKRSKTFNQQHSKTERNIHLGIDLWIDAETKVLSAFNGEIHSFKNNIGFGDYGIGRIYHFFKSCPN